MLKNRRLARKIADAGFGEIRRQVGYKAGWAGGTVITASRWFPSSKTCSDCGAVKAKLPLHIRVFDCDECALVMDRDENTARNLAAVAATCTTGTGVAGDQDAQASNPRGVDQKTRALAPAARPGRGGQVAETCRASGRPKRETVNETPSLSRSGGPLRTFPSEKPGIAKIP